MATGRRRGRAILLLALILILVIVLVFAVVQLKLLPGVIPTPPGAQTNGTVAEPLPTSTPETVKVWAVNQEIRMGQMIDSSYLYQKEMGIEDEVEGTFYFHVGNAKEETSLFQSRATTQLYPGITLTTDLVAAPGESSPLASFEIPRGMVAISVPISRLSAVSYGLQKYDHVNVIVSMLFLDLDTNWQSKLPNRTGLLIAPGPMNEDQSSITAIISSGDAFANSPMNGSNSYVGRIEIEPAANSPMWVIQGEASRPRLISQTLIQDVMILQMGYFGQDEQAALAVAATPEPGAANAGTETAAPAEPAKPDIVTLIVSPQDAVTLNYLMLSGAKLNIVLRSAGDDTRVDTEAVTLQFLMDQYRIPNPAKLPYGTEPRIDSFPDFVPMFPEPGPSPTPAQ